MHCLIAFFTFPIVVLNLEILIPFIKVKSYLWFGNEGPSRDGEAVADSAEILSHDRQTAPLSAACAGRQPLDGDDNY